MNRLFLVIISLNLLLSCEKTEEPSQTALEFYLLKDYQTYDHVKIDENTAVISDSVLIQYDSIISYNKSTYAFKITDSTINYDSREFSPILGKAFAVTIDKNIIYTGYFWSGYRSLGCNWIVIDLVRFEWENELIVELGYPGLVVGDTIPDKRNDERILELLKRDNKLLE